MKFSFEFFPPNDQEGLTKLMAVADRLSKADPEYLSVTFGAGGATQEKTLNTVRALVAQGYTVSPHISCVGANQASIQQLLDTYVQLGIRHLVALRGDLPSGMVERGDFRFASDLVRFISDHYGEQFAIKVASYPETHPAADSSRTDLQSLKNKFEAGASSAITQFYYNPDAYWDHCTQAKMMGITQPIVPGVMPIHNFSAISRFAETCGAQIPRWLVKRCQALGDDVEAIREVGLSTVVRVCESARDAGAKSIHFYTMNQSKLSLQVIERLTG